MKKTEIHKQIILEDATLVIYNEQGVRLTSGTIVPPSQLVAMYEAQNAIKLVDVEVEVEVEDEAEGEAAKDEAPAKTRRRATE